MFRIVHNTWRLDADVHLRFLISICPCDPLWKQLASSRLHSRQKCPFLFLNTHSSMLPHIQSISLPSYAIHWSERIRTIIYVSQNHLLWHSKQLHWDGKYWLRIGVGCHDGGSSKKNVLCGFRESCASFAHTKSAWSWAKKWATLIPQSFKWFKPLTWMVLNHMNGCGIRVA